MFEQVTGFISKHKRVLVIAGIIIALLFFAWLYGYWMGGGEVTGAQGGNSPGTADGPGTTKYLEETGTKQREASAAIREAATDTAAAGNAIRAAAGTSEALEQSITDRAGTDAESRSLTAECLKIARDSEQVFSSTVYPDQAGTAGGQKETDTDGGLHRPSGGSGDCRGN